MNSNRHKAKRNALQSQKPEDKQIVLLRQAIEEGEASGESLLSLQEVAALRKSMLSQ